MSANQEKLNSVLHDSLSTLDELIYNSGRNQEERMSMFFALLPYPAWIKIFKDGKMHIVNTNLKYRQMFGTGALLWSATELVENKDYEAMTTSTATEFDIDFTSLNDKKWRAHVLKYPIVSNAGTLIGIAGIMTECHEIE